MGWRHNGVTSSGVTRVWELSSQGRNQVGGCAFTEAEQYCAVLCATDSGCATWSTRKLTTTSSWVLLSSSASGQLAPRTAVAPLPLRALTSSRVQCIFGLGFNIGFNKVTVRGLLTSSRYFGFWSHVLLEVRPPQLCSSHLESRSRVVREPFESRSRVVRAPSVTAAVLVPPRVHAHTASVREPLESRQRAVRGSHLPCTRTPRQSLGKSMPVNRWVKYLVREPLESR